MGELPKQLLAWIARWLPKQSNQGDGAVQIGKAGGNVTTSHVTIVNFNHHHNVQSPPPQDEARKAPQATPQQKEVLKMIRRLPNGHAVLNFMEREFGTRMVIQLNPAQLSRVRKYIEVVQSRSRI